MLVTECNASDIQKKTAPIIRVKSYIYLFTQIRAGFIHLIISLLHRIVFQQSMQRRISYVTDLEGDFEYFKKFCSNSRVVRLQDSVLEFLNDDDYFVFGGDLFDRGNGDLRLSKLFCDFKQQHPDRVFLLQGNRDINKMRFSSELRLDVPPENAFCAWWDPKAPTLAEYLKENNLQDSVKNRLVWALKHTLGCPKTFDYRREELHILTGNDVSDEEVVQSFIDCVEKEDGAYYRYLKHSQLAVVIDGNLFVHGAANKNGLGFVPDLSVQFKENKAEEITGAYFEDFDEWLVKLNEFSVNSIKDWRERMRWGKDGKRGGDALMAYQNKPAMRNKTICVHCYVDGKNIATKSAYEGNSSTRSGKRDC